MLALVCLPLSAQSDIYNPADYPTLAALEAAEIPPRDRIDLAERLLGITDIPQPPVSPAVHRIGDQQTFFVTNSTAGDTIQTPATLRAIGEHIYLWVENGADLTDEELQALADAFDQRVYPRVRALWGAENSPGIDGDPRIYGLISGHLGASAAAYFSSDHTYPTAAVSTSNAHEMFFFNLETFNGIASLDSIESIVSHEFQHMIRNHIHPNLDLWLNEGFSLFTQVYLYGDLGSMPFLFLNTPDTQLNSWTETFSSRVYNYGASTLFLTYFYERYGIDAIRALSADPSSHALSAFDHVLTSMGEPGVDTLFADWVMANALFDASIGDGRYGYPSLTIDDVAAQHDQTVTAYPFEFGSSVRQYATDYVLLDNLDGVEALTIHVDAPADVSLIDQTGQTGRFWYSNRGDISDTTLTRAFDLTGLTTATLNYRLWYHTEALWDFGYVTVSEDGGETWEVLSTPNTTTDNPHGAAYGTGYNGMSGNGDSPIWVNESVALDAYAGREILVRFEMITDDGVNQPGMAIDDISVPELGYASDFENDDGGWDAAGWLVTDNRLPQELWLQVAQLNGSDTTVTRWRSQGENNWRLELTPGTQQAILALSAFAPVTTIPMPYTLTITTE